MVVGILIGRLLDDARSHDMIDDLFGTFTIFRKPIL